MDTVEVSGGVGFRFLKDYYYFFKWCSFACLGALHSPEESVRSPGTLPSMGAGN